MNKGLANTVRRHGGARGVSLLGVCFLALPGACSTSEQPSSAGSGGSAGSAGTTTAVSDVARDAASSYDAANLAGTGGVVAGGESTADGRDSSGRGGTPGRASSEPDSGGPATGTGGATNTALGPGGAANIKGNDGASSSGGSAGFDGAVGANGPVAVATETGQDHGQAYLSLDAAPPYNYFIGAWTHVEPPIGSGPKGNDYPFAVFCQEGEVSFVSGNFASPYNYNANIMTFDSAGNYINDYTFFADPNSTEAICRDWVYVGWHFQRTGGSTSVTQYVKYVGSSNVVDSTIVQSVPGDWTPTRVCVGTDPIRYPDTPMYIMYARIYALDVPPSAAEVQAIYLHSATPDATAWADWPLVAGNPADVSGHGRDLTVTGTIAPGIPGPPQMP